MFDWREAFNLSESVNHVEIGIAETMKNQTLQKWSWLLVLCFISTLALSACKHTEEHPSKEHPKAEHPGTNAPSSKP